MNAVKKFTKENHFESVTTKPKIRSERKIGTKKCNSCNSEFAPKSKTNYFCEKCKKRGRWKFAVVE